MVGLLSKCFASSAPADQIIYQPGPVEGSDVWLSSQYDYGNNFGVDDDKLQVGGWGDEYRFLFKPNLIGLPQYATGVELWMVPFARGDASTPTDLYIDRVTSNWDENAGWYDGQPASTPLWWVGAPTPGYWYGLNITSVYNNWQSGAYPNYGFKFRPVGINNQFSQFRSSDYWYPKHRPQLVITYNGANLGFPLEKPRPAGFIGPMPLMSPYAAQINSVLDHSLTNGTYCRDNLIVAYTDERAEAEHGLSEWFTPSSSLVEKNCQGEKLHGYAQKGNAPFIVNGVYNPSGKTFLFYDGHDGYDYQASDGTPVYAAAEGTAHFSTGIGEQNVHIVHPSEYTTYYYHMKKRLIIEGQYVSKGQQIGVVGALNHLHFTVKKGTPKTTLQLADPYGWKGAWGTDPLKVDGKDNVCLWEKCQWW